MFIELNLDDGPVILNVDHIITIDIVEHCDVYEQEKPTHFVLRIRTTDENYFFKHFAVHNDVPGQYAFDYFEKLSKMLNVKKEEIYK